MGEKKKISPRMVVLMTGLILAPFVGWLGWEGWQEWRLASADQSSTCAVLGVGTEAWSQTDADGSPQGDGYVPWVILVHTIAGERFERRDEGPSSDTVSEAESAVADVSLGQQVPCRYVAGDPAMVVYFEHSEGSAQAKLAGAAAMLLMLLGTFVWARTRPDWAKK